MSCGPEGFLPNGHLCFLVYKENKVRQGSIFEFTTLQFEPLDLQTKNDPSIYAVYLIRSRLIKNLFIQFQMTAVLHLQWIFPVTSSLVSFMCVSKACLRPPRGGGKHWPSMTCIPNPQLSHCYGPCKEFFWKNSSFLFCPGVFFLPQRTLVPLKSLPPISRMSLVIHNLDLSIILNK